MVMIFDTFMFGSAEAEVDILECRLRELEDIPNLHHVIVEAEITHRGDKKPMWFREYHERFKPWKPRITYVHVMEYMLPSKKEKPDPWEREWAQREFCRAGLDEAQLGDFVLHGDCDEIPRPGAILAVTTKGKELQWIAAFQMRLCMYAVDWLHPFPWHGTIITPYHAVGEFKELRALRNTLNPIMDGGSHLSWMGGTEAHRAKLDTHCHLEMTAETEEALRSGEWLREGRHSDGHKLEPVDVDETWPRWVYERGCPDSWWRPREEAA